MLQRVHGLALRVGKPGPQLGRVGRLAAFGRAWLGRDAETGATGSVPSAGDLIEASWRTVVAEAALYGFHATLKPPFQLAPGSELADLEQAVAETAARSCATPRMFSMKGPSAGSPQASSEAVKACVKSQTRRGRTADMQGSGR